MPRILISPYKAFIPIAKALHRRGIEVVAFTPEWARQLTNVDVPAKPLSEWGQGMEDGAFGWAAACIKALPGIVHGLNGDYPGLGFLQQSGDPFYLSRLVDMGMLVLALENCQPDLILVQNDVMAATRAAALWARERGKPCVHSPHAIYQFVERTEFGTDVHDLVSATHLVVGGPFQRAWYEHLGAGNVAETGLPQFDPWCVRERMDKAEARRVLGLDPDRPTVIYIGSWGQTTNLVGTFRVQNVELTYLAFLESMTRLPEAQAIVKCHPAAHKSNWDWHYEQACQAGVDGVVTPTSLETCLDASDVLISYGPSNTLLEASFNLDLRLLATYGYEDDAAVGKVGLEQEDIEAGIRHALGSKAPSTRALQAKYLGECDGRAGERITELCLGLM